MNEQEKKTENSENLPATVDARKDLTQVSGSYYEMREQVAEPVVSEAVDLGRQVSEPVATHSMAELAALERRYGPVEYLLLFIGLGLPLLTVVGAAIYILMQQS